MKPLYFNSWMHMNKTRPLPQLKKIAVGAMLLLTATGDTRGAMTPRADCGPALQARFQIRRLMV